MNIALRRPMSREEFLDWDGHDEGRYEFDGVRPVAMTGGSVEHGFIISSIILKLGIRLAGSAFFATGPEVGIATVGGRVRYPDVVVSCSPFRRGDKLLSNPVVVFEVVSPRSEHTDRVIKPVEYAAIPSILRYCIVDSTSAAALVHWRATGNEAFELLPLNDRAVLPLPELGTELPLAEIYERVLP